MWSIKYVYNKTFKYVCFLTELNNTCQHSLKISKKTFSDFLL